VGKKKKNTLGVYDMSGNVWEWTLDEYESSYSGAPGNGLPVCSTPICRQGSSRRVNRGGSWYNDARRLRVADRNRYAPDNRYSNLGARLCRTSSKSKNTRKKPPPPQKRNSRSKNKSASDLLKDLRMGKTGSRKPLDLGKTTKKGPKKPSKSDIVKTMRRVNVRRCGSRDPSLKGTVKVRIKAVSSGAIIQVKTQNSPFNRSPVGSCIEDGASGKGISPRIKDATHSKSSGFRGKG
jgi:hypothetical protein